MTTFRSRVNEGHLSLILQTAIIMAIVGTVGLSLQVVVKIVRGPFVMPWQASQFWVDYSDGFVRRGLPGQLLSWADDGSLSMVAVELASGVFLAAGVVAWFSLAAALRGRGAYQLAIIALVMSSPFSISLLARDIGRYDVLAVVVLAALVWLREWAESWLFVVTATILIAVAAAAEEFLVAYTAPVAVALVLAAVHDRQQRVVRSLLIVIPGAVIAGMSLLVMPTQRSLLSAADRAAAAGAGTDRFGENAIAALSQGMPQTLQNLRETSPATVVIGVLLLGGCWAASTGIIWTLQGSRNSRIFILNSTYYLIVTIGLSLGGIDYRRWWALAFAASVATLVTLRRNSVDRNHGVSRRALMLTVVVLLSGTAGQIFPIYPKWDNGAATHVVLEPRPFAGLT